MSKAENLVIMFTDIVGFTELTSAQSREQNENMLKQQERLLLSEVKKFGGKRIKSIGDALLLVFRSPTDAVHCAMAMQDSLWEYNQNKVKEERIAIRVALNSGEVRLQSGDVFGEPVNVAARLEGITPANEVYFTEAIYLSMNKAEVLHEFVGENKLKGIPEKISVYRVPRGAAAQRLIVVDNDDDEITQNQYPFGGMHRLEKNNKQRLPAILPLKKVAVAASMIVAIICVGLFLPSLISSISPAVTPLTEQQAELTLLLESNDLLTLQSRISELLENSENEPLALFMQGHLDFEKNNYQSGLENYNLAISTQPIFAENERYANNLIRGLSGNGSLITEMVKLSPTDQVVEQLSLRSIEPGLNGRRDAAYILRLIDRQDKMDSVAMAILDIDETTDCDDKKDAIAILKNRKDQRGLPALEPLAKGGIGTLFKNNCGRKEAREAIDVILGRSSA